MEGSSSRADIFLNHQFPPTPPRPSGSPVGLSKLDDSSPSPHPGFTMGLCGGWVSVAWGGGGLRGLEGLLLVALFLPGALVFHPKLPIKPPHPPRQQTGRDVNFKIGR